MKSIDKITIFHQEIKKSKFITTLIPCDNVEDAPKLINNINKQYPDANHNCFAYIIGNQEKANDDGEPSGTAGLPMLNVLKKQELTNIIAIVTRYFGGIKLGAGGLTRAYSKSVSQAILEADIVEKEPVDLYKISIDYSHSKKIEHLLKSNNISIEKIDYDLKVNYLIYIKDNSLFKTIQDLTSNQYEKEFITQVYRPK